MLNKKLTTANVTVKNDVVLNQQMVRVQQMMKAAGALSLDDVISSDITISRKPMFTSRRYLKLAIAKRCRSNKLVRQRFAFALKFQQKIFMMRKTSRSWWKQPRRHHIC
ncbi:tRNA wybutosine-synthesizing protein 2/3/4 [Dorcoceras hygrometricum]|uniref:tRNA wybutosine-synthesizing protein 2/3/4 n=1 Tax=Dorcoceras hygrometricum TaxID=472368 RepID=A0A2Z6ZUC7_9LAMI|nr:tRNA wybutosine-synthesizing protein 2/3/4 [Dorcoceras hygrometricum]